MKEFKIHSVKGQVRGQTQKSPFKMKNVIKGKANKYNRLNVGRIALERLVGALISCSLLQSGGGGGRDGEPKWD